jgi:PilZ domain-containing protein
VAIYKKFSKNLNGQINLRVIGGGHALNLAKRVVDTVISSTFERRRAPRYPVQQIGMIVARSGGQLRYCLIMDRSESGVRLRTTSDFQVPDQFVLGFAATEARYVVVWRKGSILGAKRVS